MSEAIAPPETRTKEAEQLADRYVALWNEPDPERRRRMIAELWTEDEKHEPHSRHLAVRRDYVFIES